MVSEKKNYLLIFYYLPEFSSHAIPWISPYEIVNNNNLLIWWCHQNASEQKSKRQACFSRVISVVAEYKQNRLLVTDHIMLDTQQDVTTRITHYFLIPQPHILVSRDIGIAIE